MQQLDFGNYLSKFKVDNKVERWKLIGEELQKTFNKNLYWIFYRQGMTNEKAVEALDVCKREGIFDSKYFLAVLKNKGVKLF